MRGSRGTAGGGALGRPSADVGARGRQHYRRKACGPNFTATPPRALPLRVKATAVRLYLSRPSMNRTAQLLGVSTPGVMARIERFARFGGNGKIRDLSPMPA